MRRISNRELSFLSLTIYGIMRDQTIKYCAQVDLLQHTGGEQFPRLKNVLPYDSSLYLKPSITVESSFMSD